MILIKMDEMEILLVALVAGMLTGIVFFGGLWLTLKKWKDSPKAGLWFFISFLLRSIITLGLFYWVSAGDWKRFLACLAGFILSRVIITRVIKSEKKMHFQKETKNEN